MKICAGCFKDIEIRSFIESQGKQGSCDFCDKYNVVVIDIEELHDFFQELISNFKLDSKHGDKFTQQLDKWDIFYSQQIINKVFIYILPFLDTDIKDPTQLINYSDDILNNVSYWNEVKDRIKWQNRFILNITHLVEDLGWDSFFNTQDLLSPKDIFYRARVHFKSGMEKFTCLEMGAPPKDVSKSGRANSLGIPSLYLCDNPKTVCYEVRASYLDELSIGLFRVAQQDKPITIVDFTKIISLYKVRDINTAMKAQLLRQHISVDLSKPMRRYDSEIEYIPTQFICEFIKEITNVSGIKFKSSLDPEGSNIVIFDQNLMECTEVKRVKIKNLKMDYEEMYFGAN